MPRLIDIDLRAYFPFLNRKNSSLPRGEMLALRPLRNQAIAWEMKTDTETPGANLTVPRREDKFGQIVSRIFQVPSTKTIELDEFGAAVWEKCDGRHSVEHLQAEPASGRSQRRVVHADAGPATLNWPGNSRTEYNKGDSTCPSKRAATGA